MLKAVQNEHCISIELQCVLTAPALKITRMQYVFKEIVYLKIVGFIHPHVVSKLSIFCGVLKEKIQMSRCTLYQEIHYK